MIHFEWLWAFLFLPLPWFAHRFLSPAAHHHNAALRVPFLDDFRAESSPGNKPFRRWPLWLALCAWLLAILALAQPQWLGDSLEVPISGRDLVLAVDLSESMQQSDFKLGSQMVDRLTATKAVAGDFIERRVGDRIGLILFGTQAYLQAPLTFDRKTVRTLLNEAAIGLAGPHTAIGDAIGLAIKRLQGHDATEQVLILLTDGANTAGVIEPVKAAELAAKVGLKVHTIGVGADEMIKRSLFGQRRVNPSLELDEATLTKIADLTGGRYFRARDINELDEIYAMLDKLEPIEREKQHFRPHTTLFYWPLALACALALGLVLATYFRSHR